MANRGIPAERLSQTIDWGLPHGCSGQLTVDSYGIPFGDNLKYAYRVAQQYGKLVFGTHAL